MNFTFCCKTNFKFITLLIIYLLIQNISYSQANEEISAFTDNTNLKEYSYNYQSNSANLLYKTIFLFKISPVFYKTKIAFLIYVILIISFIIMVIKWMSYQFAKEKYKLEKIINKRTKELIKQKEQIEELLSNILTKEEAEKLKQKDKIKSTRYKMVTVLFSDILGFTKVVEQKNADVLIDELDRFFFHFDKVVKKFNIEKIRTIGDSYMCAGGIPQKNRTNPIEVVLAAFEMQQYMQNLKNDSRIKNREIWDLRIGIHTGPVFAEIAQHKKNAFDIWGESVNIASRMESSGQVGKVNISGNTYELIREYFICKYRGNMPVKYKGEIDMYFIEGFRPRLSVDGLGIIPNDSFNTKLALIRYDDLDEFVMDKLEKELPKNLYYHNIKHSIDVIVQVEIIGKSEGITEDELLLLKTAALFHDTGFTIGYKEHEMLGTKLAKDILPYFDYTEEQIKIICDLINATKLPPEPKNKLEKIICDADLDYLGRVDFIPVSQNLFRELVEHNMLDDDINAWNKMQIKFIANHQYFTETAKNLRDVNKKKQLEIIKSITK